MLDKGSPRQSDVFSGQLFENGRKLRQQAPPADSRGCATRIAAFEATMELD